jgi:hypothetical protein
MCPLFLAELHQALILNYSSQPPSERSFTLKLLQVFKSVSTGALNRIFSGAHVAHDQQCPLHTATAVTLDEFVECLDISVPGNYRQLVVIRITAHSVSERATVGFDPGDLSREPGGSKWVVAIPWFCR